jgi:hypothetical protein
VLLLHGGATNLLHYSMLPEWVARADEHGLLPPIMMR